MATAIAPGANLDSVVKLVPGGAPSLAQLSDDELLANTRRLVGKTNQLLAALLLHLAEVETRGIHRKRCCASLYTYCIYELRFSEDAAARRSAAARFVKQFPALLAAVAAGELHLTGLLMIGPHLTPQNEAEVLGRAKFRTKKELAKLVRDLNPLPGVPDLVAPLGPELVIARRKATREDFLDGLLGPVKELPLGERPRDWVDDSGRREGNADTDEATLPVGPVPADLPPVTSPQQYALQFSTVEEHARLIEKAKALLARSRPGITLGELHLEAMRLLVASLEKRKFAAGSQVARSPANTGHPRQRGEPPTEPNPGLVPVPTIEPEPEPEPDPHPALLPPPVSEPPRQRGAGIDESAEAKPPRQRSANRSASSEAARPRSRHVPAIARRQVYERDAGRCSYVDDRGERCKETSFLDIHHVNPFGKNGEHVVSNLALRCAAHNALAAEQDFGKEHMEGRRDSTRHESLVRQV